MKETAEKFITAELKSLRLLDTPAPFANLEDEICRLILSNKFRKYGANEKLRAHIKSAVAHNVQNNLPINITFLGGSFKLWRLDESPEVDWAELFALMYYTNWMKPILAIYKPGAVLDFYLDDLIMEKISNYTREEIVAFQTSFRAVMDFLKQYVPSNLQFKITTVSSIYGTEENLWAKLDAAVAKWKPATEITLTPDKLATLTLNYRPKPNEKLGKLWREENTRVHDAYIAMTDRKFFREGAGKIMAIPYHKGFDMGLHVGSTKDSIVKYWVGVGALRPRGDSFMPTVLSLRQLENAIYDTHDISVAGLNGKNFKSIRILI